MALLTYVLAAAIGILLLFQAALQSWRLAAVLLLVLPVSLAGGLLVALATGNVRSLGADAGLLSLFALAARQGLLQIGHIRGQQAQHGGELTAEIVVQAAGERLAPSLGAVAVVAVALLPFVAIGDVAGNEITHVAAAVILGGLVSVTLLNQILLPALCLALAPAEPIQAADPLTGIADPAAVATPTPSAF